MARVTFGPWLPDLGPANNPGVLDAFNVFPHPNGYRPVRDLRDCQSLTAGTTITAGQVMGGFMTLNQNEAPEVFVATVGKVWNLTLGPMAVSNIAVDRGNASISNMSTNFITFARYGSLVIWASRGAQPQKATISTSTATFQALGGTPPANPILVFVVRDFVVFGNISGATSTLQWSALGNAEDYVASAVTQSDSQNIQDEGPILGAVGGEFGLVFFRNAVFRMTYIGSPVIFQFDKIENANFEFITKTTGSATTTAPKVGYLTAKLGNDVYFLTSRGLCVIRQGQIFQNLSEGRNADYFLDRGPAGFSLGLVSMLASDMAHRRIFWGICSTAGGFTLDSIIIYDAGLDQFSRISVDTSFMISSGLMQDNFTFPSTVVYVRSSSGGQIAQHGLQTGAVLPATIETADFNHISGQHAFVNSVRPIVEHLGASGLPMVQVGTRSKNNQSISYSATVTINNNGETPQRASGLYHRYKVSMSVSASWSFMTGIEVSAIPDGER